MRVILFVLAAILAAPVATAEPVSCRPAYCSATITFLGGRSDNIDRSFLSEEAPWASTTVELRADAVPLGNKVYAALSLLAVLQDRVDRPGDNIGILIPQINLGREVFGLRFSAAYAPVLIYRDAFGRETARFHDFNFGIKETWKDHPWLTDRLDLRVEYKARVGEPISGSENRITVEAEATEFFDLWDREFRLWGEFRAEAGVFNRDRAGTRIVYRFQNQIDLTTQLNEHVRLTLLSVRRDDRLESPRTTRFGRWDLAAGVRLRYAW